MLDFGRLLFLSVALCILPIKVGLCYVKRKGCYALRLVSKNEYEFVIF